jgi:membrane-associated phospholipid phosphatase
MKRDWFGSRFRERLPVLVFLLFMLSLYFPVNQINSGRGGFAPTIEAIDGQMPLYPVFVIPYVVGFLTMGLFPTFAAWKFPRDLFQEYALALFTVIIVGFSLWLLLPAYVIKDPIVGDGFFLNIVKMLHDGDSTYGTHNAIPSSHVYYVTLAMCYFVQYNARLTIPLIIFAVFNALSTMLTHQHYFLDVMTGFLVVWAVFEFTRRVSLPLLRRLEARYGMAPVSPQVTINTQFQTDPQN